MFLMVTDGGPHPPEKWAALTASQVIEIASTASGALLSEARTFQAKVEAVLVAHHRLVQDHERDALASEGPDRLATDIDTSGHLPDAVDDVIAAARGTSFAAHFAKPETRAYLEELLHNHFHQSMWIERSQIADATPDHLMAKCFRAVATHGHTLLPLHDKDLKGHGGRESVSRMIAANHLSAIRVGS